jgi:ankyrin repeat protein
LLVSGVDVHVKTDRGDTALSLAMTNGRADIATFLRKAGAAE